jgi:hypothetical protein
MSDDATRQEILYTKIWAADPEYGTAERDVIETVQTRIAPHMRRVFGLDRFSKLPGIHVVDFGAGDGRFLQELEWSRLCWKGTGIDLYEPTNKPDWIDWQRVPMWEATAKGDYAISTDALEHLPPEYVNRSLERIAAAAPHGFLRISLKEDRYGTERGLHLHESVFCAGEWMMRLNDAGIFPTSAKLYYDQPGVVEAALEVWY